MGDIDFEEQLELERLEKEKREKDGHPAEKVDPDGTVYEWDYDKKAWFPKIDAAFIAQYQMNYGVDTDSSDNKAADTQPDTQPDPSQQSYQDYYNYAQRDTTEAGETTHGSQEEYQQDSAEVMAQYTEEQKKQYNEYWSYYYGTDYHDYYSDCMAQNATSDLGANQSVTVNQSVGQSDTPWNKGDNTENQTVGNDKEKGKKAKKRKQPQPKREEGWFEVEEKHNTNVYISGLPPDITQDEFEELMAKYGLIMFDPRTKKPKAKLYMDEQGHPKGDGRCCYIKRESVDLALNLLDDLELRGHKIKVEMASFQMKGDYDPSKKKKKLSNKEKNRLRERQAKLFDWRPDKPRNVRQKHEKVVVLKNIFDAKDFEDNPALINQVSANMRTECEKYGSVKKVVVYDRHQDGVVLVHYKEPEEADMCVEYMNRKFLGDRRMIAETWDGQTKYDVVETEAEREARIKKWEQFLESGGASGRTVSGNSNSGTAGNGSSLSIDKAESSTQGESEDSKNIGEGSVEMQASEGGEGKGESETKDKTADTAD